jgi:hypothetical protein
MIHKEEIMKKEIKRLYISQNKAILIKQKKEKIETIPNKLRIRPQRKKKIK